MQTISISLSPWRTIGKTGAAVFGIFMIVSIYAQQVLVAPFFLPFFILSVYLFFCYGSLEIDAEEIRNVAPSGVYSIKWRDVTEAEFAQSQIVLKGNGKRLVIPNPTYWRSSDRIAGLAALEGFFFASGVVPKVRHLADFKFSRITKR